MQVARIDISGNAKTKDYILKEITQAVTITAARVKPELIMGVIANQTAKNDWVEDANIQSMLNSRDTYNVANNIDLERTETES